MTSDLQATYICASCRPGYRLAYSTSCTMCGQGTYNPGGKVQGCSACPVGTSVGPGQGVTADDCEICGQLFTFRKNLLMCGRLAM